jgi:hypothetical protein
MITFTVTYEMYTQESVEIGESEDIGFVAKNVSLREAMDLVNETESNKCSQTGIEASASFIGGVRWITVYNSQSWDSGVGENRSLHIPDEVTDSSRIRICKLFGLTVK